MSENDFNIGDNVGLKLSLKPYNPYKYTYKVIAIEDKYIQLKTIDDIKFWVKKTEVNKYEN